MTMWVVTGANRGIGLELCKQIAARGDDVVAACRASSPALDALGVRVVSGVDVTTDAGAEALARAVDGRRIDVLLHNAGILVRDSIDTLDLDEVRRQLEVNAVGPLRLTKALLPRLGSGSKLAFVSSRVGSIGDNASGGMYGYRMSKVALNMAGRSLARDLAPRGILVALLHPGFVRTEMTKGAGNHDPDEAASGLLARIDELTPERSGRFFHANGDELPW
jgi:NAD(P)-dependent dehydrogenase (short-subunit alcohol dehydrogenase family)